MSHASTWAPAIRTIGVAVILAACARPSLGFAQIPGAAAQQQAAITTLCRFDSGPRAGTSVAMAGAIDAVCDDGAGSKGVIVPRHVINPGAQMRLPPGGVLHPQPQPQPKTVEIQRPAPPAAASPPAAAPPNVPPLGTRSFVPPDYQLPAGYGAVGVVAFRASSSTGAERARRILICKAYVTTLQDATFVLHQSPATPQIVTLWPIDDLDKPFSVNAPPVGSMLDSLCANSVDHYAHLAGDQWVARLPAASRPAADRRGPFLIAWAPPSTQLDPNTPVLVVDLTDFEQEETINQAFAIWKDKIEREPRLWSNGWDRTLLKLQLRDTSDHFGGLVLAAFKLLPFVAD